MALELVLMLLIFAIQWLAFLPACYYKTERFYDLTGGLTYTVVILAALLLTHLFSGTSHWRSALLALLVVVWSLRLGLFLFLRIRAAGSDSRFEKIKVAPMRFFIAWTLQAVWITFTLSAAVLAITSVQAAEFGFISMLGLVLWVAGFSIELVADGQKSRFRKNPANANNFISSGSAQA